MNRWFEAISNYKSTIGGISFSIKELVLIYRLYNLPSFEE